MSEEPVSPPTKAERKAARGTAQERVGRYHEQELGLLVDRLREALRRLDAGEIDVFELDDVVHHYKRAAQKLWSYCVGRGNPESMARALEWAEEHDDRPDWWALAAPRQRPAPEGTSRQDAEA